MSVCQYTCPVARVMPISQVRLLQKYPSCGCAVASAASCRVAEAVSSGTRNSRSPVNPQHPALAGTTAVALYVGAFS